MALNLFQTTEMKASNSHVQTWKGYLFIVFAAIFWAVSGSSAKFLFKSGMTPFQLVQLRLMVASSGLFLWLVIRKPALLKIAHCDIFYFILFGVIGMAGLQFTYLFSISKIPVAVATLLQYLAPSLIAIYSILIFKDKLMIWTTVALCIAFLGCYLVVGAYRFDILTITNIAGIISGILSAVTFAWYSIHGEYGMRHYNPWTVLFYALFIAAIVWNILYPPLESLMQNYTFIQWFWIFYIGIMGTLVPFGLYLEGINLIRATRASITATVEPIVAGVLSYIFLNELLETPQLLGGMLVICSIVLLQLKQDYDQKAPILIRTKTKT